MATTDLYSQYLNPATPEILGLERQKAYAKMLMAQSAQPQGQMVSGQFVAPSWTQQLNAALNPVIGAYLTKSADDEALKLATKLRGEQTRLGREYLQSLTPSTEVVQMAGPYGQGVGPEGRDIPMPTSERTVAPNYQKAFEIANDPNAPTWVKSQMAEMLKPRVFKEGETFSLPTFTGGQFSFQQAGAGGVSLPSDVKSAAVRVGLDPTKAASWGPNELQLINNRIEADKRSGATNLTVNTGKAYTGAFGEGIAKEDLSKYTIAEKAPSIFQNAVRTEELLDKGAITGLGATYKLNLARALNVAGANNNEIIKNTEALVSNRGQIVLDSIKASGLGAGQGFTNTDREFLERVKGGTIELNDKTLRELSRIEKNVAQASVESWNKRLPNIPKEAIQGTGVGPVSLPAQTRNFSSEADAQREFTAGRLKKGDKVIINGVVGTWN